MTSAEGLSQCYATNWDDAEDQGLLSGHEEPLSIEERYGGESVLMTHRLPRHNEILTRL